MRKEEISKKLEAILKRLACPLKLEGGLLLTELFTLRYQVDRSNLMCLSKLPGSAKYFKAKDSGAADVVKRLRLLESMPAKDSLDLKEDAQVILIKNVDKNLLGQ